MGVLYTAALAGMSVPKRATLFGLAAVAGGLAGLGWSVDLTNWAYYGFLQGFLDPRAPIASLAVGVALALPPTCGPGGGWWRGPSHGSVRTGGSVDITNGSVQRVRHSST